MAGAAFGKLGAKLVDDFGASTDEAARILKDLDEDTARALNENPEFLDEIQDVRVGASDDGGFLASRLDNIGSAGDETASLVPQSRIGRIGAGVAGAGLTFKGLDVLGEREERLASQAESDIVEEQAKTLQEVVKDPRFSSQKKAEILSDLAGSGFVSSGVGRNVGGTVGSGAGAAGSDEGPLGGVIPDDPIVLIIGVIVLVIVLRNVLDEEGNGGS